VVDEGGGGGQKELRSKRDEQRTPLEKEGTGFKKRGRDMGKNQDSTNSKVGGGGGKNEKKN